MNSFLKCFARVKNNERWLKAPRAQTIENRAKMLIGSKMISRMCW